MSSYESEVKKRAGKGYQEGRELKFKPVIYAGIRKIK